MMFSATRQSRIVRVELLKMTKEESMNENNLIPVASVAENTKAIKIGDNVFQLVVVQQGGGCGDGMDLWRRIYSRN